MIIKLLRLLLGFVEFEATKGFSERFLNLCTVNGITLWNVQNNGIKVRACTSINGYKNIRKSARNSGMRVRIVKKRGLPFFIKQNKSRVGVLIGILVAVSFLFVSSCVLWDIEVTGNSFIKSETLLESLSNKGVKVGVFKEDIDTIRIKNELLKEYPELSWVSINIFGTKAVLEVKENTEKPEIIDNNTPTNIVARKDGQIILVEGYRGSNAVKEGDVVVKGDLLISGVTVNSDGSENTVCAKGKVYAETITELKESVEGTNTIEILNSSEAKYYIYLLGAEIPLFFKCEGNMLYNDQKLLKGNETTLPFGVSWKVIGEKEGIEITFSENQINLLSLKKIIEKKRTSFSKDAEFKAVSFKQKSVENGAIISCKIKAKENIAIEKEIFVEQ